MKGDFEKSARGGPIVLRVRNLKAYHIGVYSAFVCLGKGSLLVD